MWNQACSQSGGLSCKTSISKTAALQILPCTVSQILSASQVNNAFAMCGWEINQVSVVGVIRSVVPVLPGVQYSVDDMTAPPLIVKEWAESEDQTLVPPGAYVKATGRLCDLSGQRLLVAACIRRIQDLNEITSHMLEVVRAHMQRRSH